MIYFLKHILTFIQAIIVSPGIIVFGSIYAIGHSVYMSVKNNNRVWIDYLIRFIDGIFFTIGYILFHLAKGLDLLWNVVAGEMFEDLITRKENTLFGTRDITISEATGKEQHFENLTRFGQWFSRQLNRLFKQKQHCLDAYYLGVKRKELESNYYL